MKSICKMPAHFKQDKGAQYKRYSRLCWVLMLEEVNLYKQGTLKYIYNFDVCFTVGIDKFKYTVLLMVKRN